MTFKNEQDTQNISNHAAIHKSYWAIVWQHFRKNRTALWSLRCLYVLLFIAVFADFLANDKPIVCKIEGEIHFPIFQEYAVDLGLSSWEEKFFVKEWSEHEYEFKIMPLVPYSATFQDKKNWDLISPFGDQNVSSMRYWHWMGTGELGKDILAGMIAGTRVAMMVGVISMSIASLIGILLGTFAGFFGDNLFKISRIRLLLNILAIPLAVFYGFIVRSYLISEADKQGYLGTVLFKSMAIALGIILLFNLFASFLKFLPFLAKKVTIPMDILVMRLIEIFNSIPVLLLLLAVIAIIEKPSILYVMVIIGLVSWTGIARFTRAELLKIRQLEYIKATQAMGFGRTRIIFRHAIPNALGPVLITVAFGVAGAILVEAALSFLGLGGGQNEVTWGILLRDARSNFSAWWLAVFPGLAIFVTVTIFNLIGEGLTEALDPKQQG